MRARLGDWLGYAGLAVLVAAVALPFARPEWSRFRWAIVAAGVLLVLAALVLRVQDYRALFGRRTTRYGVNAAATILLLVGVIGLVEALSYRHNARLDLT